MLKLRVTSNDGYILNLSNNEKYFKLVNIDGLNPTKTNIYSSDVYTVEGSTFNYAKNETRNIVIELYLNEDRQNAKKELLKAFSNRKKITLEFDNKYTIDGYVESIDYNFFSNKIACQISVLCLYPYFKSINTTKYILNGVENLLKFPFCTPEPGIPFGNITTENNIILNESNIDAGFFIEVFFSGYTNKLTITNHTNQTYLTIDTDFRENDVLKINTFDVVKSFELNGESVLNYVKTGNKFLYLNPGNNSISFECSSGRNNVTMEITCKSIYTGI